MVLKEMARQMALRRQGVLADYYLGSLIGKTLIFEREVPFLQRNVVLLVVNEVLGN